VDFVFLLYVLLAWGIYAFGRRRLPGHLQPFAAGLAVIAGMLLGRLGLIVFLQQGWALPYWAVDVALLSPGIIWLVRRPGPAPVVYCGGYAALTIGLNLQSLALGSGPAFRASLTGALLWVAAILSIPREVVHPFRFKSSTHSG
jgi:hypothetical protein